MTIFNLTFQYGWKDGPAKDFLGFSYENISPPTSQITYHSDSRHFSSQMSLLEIIIPLKDLVRSKAVLSFLLGKEI